MALSGNQSEWIRKGRSLKWLPTPSRGILCISGMLGGLSWEHSYIITINLTLVLFGLLFASLNCTVLPSDQGIIYFIWRSLFWSFNVSNKWLLNHMYNHWNLNLAQFFLLAPLKKLMVFLLETVGLLKNTRGIEWPEDLGKKKDKLINLSNPLR